MEVPRYASSLVNSVKKNPSASAIFNDIAEDSLLNDDFND